MNNYCTLFLSFLLVSVSLMGQETSSEKQSTPPNTKEIVLDKTQDLKQDTVRVVDTTQVIKTTGELQTTTITSTSVKDSVIYVANDHPKMSQLDSIWKQELYNSSLFDTIYKSVTELKYEPVEYVDLPTDTLKARLAELNARTPFNVEYNPSLESVIKRYLKNRHKHLERLMALSEFYFPLFEQELDNQNIPLEIKYLAIVESALKPRAKSRVGATGLWQFMFGTGKMFGLEVSSYVDERMDPIMSTKAACKYLSNLYKVFGDWDLALASYNSGPGNVTKAIRRSGGYTNYWNIRHNLPRETAGYLPAFLATMYIFEYADKHGFKPRKPEFAYFETDTIRVKQMITLDQVSEYINIDIEELQFLNPSYKLDIIPYIKDEDYVLRLPLDKIGPFVTNEDQIYTLAKAEFDKREKPLPKYFEANDRIRYRVRSGDYLGKIARRYGVRVSQIKKWNGLRSNNLRIGQRLTIYPRRPVVSKPRKTTTKKTLTKVAANSSEVYTVKTGDTLWSISQKFKGVSVENLKNWNDISGSGIKPGMTLKLSKS
ncbi:membrane-bound lytic murein transglycosylase D [Aquimarina sp. EL_43]|uniref:LysM peptidoglycan-binding domain-containing protein n=1 Tax=unclassified Aquimarina TaxID=2627091 RepID=UPI001A2A8A54|nr:MULTISPECIES: LysM peptidoglycan-binding domain-containing protein [unclassified Aquimarina]MBG6131732.1 membrane-bound lytic murein transglycosylase D [Aquimarina sp. EL_35]MBG6152193.1 membrane-bound lytic murein transglycosylase D [Aquimarina sp. EL_32]MBG6169863.1 membrane-bound lytic murein transglycosylase D [Aquimarina sp. EL_43]